MSYKSEFAANNTDLQTILDMVNALPDKVKKCKVLVTVPNSYENSSPNAKVTIGETTYMASATNTPDTIIEVEVGTEITLYVASVASISNYAYITIDGEKVVSSAGLSGVSYAYTVSKDTTIELNSGSYESTFPYGYINVVTGEIEGDADISLVPETTSTFTPTDSGGTTYKSKFADNNVDLQAMLDKVNALEGVTLIEFTIGGMTYQAEEGMTWAEWVESSYNTGEYSIDVQTGYIVYGNDGETVVATTIRDRVYSSDTIVAGTAYIYGQMG